MRKPTLYLLTLLSVLLLLVFAPRPVYTQAGGLQFDSSGNAKVLINGAIAAGTNAIGKLAANSGVDIGDVDVTSISAGNNNIGDVDVASIAAGDNNIGNVDVLSVVPGTTATALGKPEDGVHASGDTGVMALCVRKDSAASVAGTDGDYQPCITASDGSVWVSVANGSSVDANDYALVSPSATATSTAGTSTCYVTSAASNNATNCKASAGNVYGIRVINTTTTNYFVRLYNLAASPTCSSATGFVETIPALGAAANGGGISFARSIPQAFSAGIGFCITGGGASTDNTNAATGVYLAIDWK